MGYVRASRSSIWNYPAVHAGLLAIALASSGCTKKASAQESTAQGAVFEQRERDLVVPERSPIRGRVSIEAVSTQLVRHELNVPASAEADPAKMTKISPPLQGRVVKLLARLGEAVHQGAPLFSFDSSDLAGAQSDYLKAKSAEVQAQRTLKRQKDLQEHGIGAQKDLEQAETDHDSAKSELARATTRLQLLGIDPGDVGKPLTVRAPISGRIIDLATAPGQYQNDPAAVLMVIADLSTIWVTANVPEKDIQRVNVGDDAVAEFSAYPGERFEGRVQFIGDVLAPETRTVKVRIQLANQRYRLKPGMFARVVLRGKESPELLVPPAALVVRGDKNFLFVEKAPWTFERRPVEVGEPMPQGIPVTRGLAAAERIVTANTILFP
jgi:cobalt-zinc-cadmium efflux system membrane fusion protein